MGCRKNVILTKSPIIVNFCKKNIIQTLRTIKNSQVTNRPIITLEKQSNSKSFKWSWKIIIFLEIKFSVYVRFHKTRKLKASQRVKDKK